MVHGKIIPQLNSKQYLIVVHVVSDKGLFILMKRADLYEYWKGTLLVIV